MTKQKPTGLSRIIKATGYSISGIKSAWKYEAAFRQEASAVSVLLPIGLFIGENGVERSILISSLMVVLITELLNSAIEAVVDRIGPEHHPLAGQAKDMGSAAVFVSIAMGILVWTFILI